MARAVLMVGLAGCASDLPVLPGEETSEGDTVSVASDTGTGDTGPGDTGLLDTGTGEGSDAGIEPECGNGIVEAGESCDEGVETATCNANCTLVGCGDGIVNAATGEQCDAGGETALCDEDCTPVSCGDGVANEAAGEECDDDDLRREACEGLGFDVGTLACEAGCTYDVSECYVLPAAPVLELGFSQVKRFDFSWAAVMGADHYRLEQSVAPGEPFVQLGGDIVGESVSVEMPLHSRWQASYRLLACIADEWCTESAVVDVVGSLAEAVGYGKASNTGTGDQFGYSVALSEDGSTLAVGARYEDSNATGVGGNQADDSASFSGAVYVYTRDGLGAWSQQAYVKGSNTGADDYFGNSVALSGDGSTLAVGAYYEDSNATGVGGNQADNSALGSGAVYVYTRDGLGAWSQQAYVKASNTGADDNFGYSVALSEDGSTLAVGAYGEDSNATGVGGNQADNSALGSGAVYVYTRDGLGAWSQQAYVKASNTGAEDYFGVSVALRGDGSTLAVGAYQEDSNGTGVRGDQANNSALESGAVYVYTRDGLGAWSQQAYVKASDTGASDEFGVSVALSGDGSTLAVGARYEDSNATGVGGNQANDSASQSGGVYVYTRDGLGAWSQQAYVKASNTGVNDNFGLSVALSGDGSTLAVGALYEDSNATGVGGNQADNSASNSGAVYVYTRDGLGAWSQQAYVKASNTGMDDRFGLSVSLSGDGSTLAVGADGEDSNATGVGGNQLDNTASASGAVYLY